MSMITKIAPEDESAETNIVAMTVALGGESSPQMMNVTVSQKTNRANSVVEMD